MGAQLKDLKMESQKASLRKSELSAEKSDTTTDDSCTKVRCLMTYDRTANFTLVFHLLTRVAKFYSRLRSV